MNASLASLAGSVLGWLADYYLLATLLLLIPLASWRWVRQPAHRILIAWTVMLELAALAVVCALPFWPRVSFVAASPSRAAELPTVVEPPVTAMFPRPLPPVAVENVGDSASAASFRREVEVAEPAAPPALSRERMTWSELAVVGYLGGAAMVVLWLCCGAAATTWLCRRAKPAADALAAELLEVIKGTEVVVARQSAVKGDSPIFAETKIGTVPQQPPPSPLPRRVPRLLASPRIATAVAMGVLRPTIVLPDAMVQSSPPHTLRAVLQHEWAHIRHRDLWLLALGRWLLAVLFAHPLFWWLRRAIRGDQELLADAVAAGDNRHDYAEELVRLVRMTGNRTPRAVSAAVGIWEGSSTFSRRIAMLLDETFRVHPIGSRRWRFRALGVLVLLGAAVSLITLQPSRSTGKQDQAAEEKAAETSPWKITLPNGATIELIGLAPNPSDGQAWWRSDGSPLPERPYINKHDSLGAPLGKYKDSRAVEVAYRIVGPGPEPKSHSCSIPDNLAMGSFICRDAEGQCVGNGIDAASVRFPSRQKTMRIRLGTVAGPWELAVKMGPRGGKCERTDLPLAEDFTVVEQNGEFIVKGVLSWAWDAEYSYRLVVVGENGVERAFTDVMSRDVTPEKKVRHWTFRDRFAKNHDYPQLSAIKEMRIEYRCFQFVEFKNVSLRPGKKTQVQVIVVADRKQGDSDKSLQAKTSRPNSPKKVPAMKSEPVLVDGRIVDDKTGEPVTQFVIQGGRADKKDPAKITWGFSETRSTSPIRDGRFQQRIDWGGGWRARIVAAGYLPQPILDKAPAAGVTRIDNYVVRLKRGRSISGRVLYHDGTPAAGASVFLVGGVPTSIGNGKAWQGPRSDMTEDKTVTKTVADADGRFTLPGARDAKSIAVSAPKLDFWAVSVPDWMPVANGPDVARPEFTVNLPEAGRLVVKYDIPGGDAKADLFLQMNTWDSPIYRGVGYTPESSVANKDQVVLGNLPPGKYYLDRPKHIAWGTYFCDRRLITIESGKTLESNFIRDRGTAVVGRVIGLKKEMRASVAGASDTVGVLISVRPSEAKGNFHDDLKLPTFDIMMCGLDGRFKTEQLLPGKYAIVVEAWLPEKPAEMRSSGIRRSSFIGRTVVTVPESGPPPQVTIELKPR